MVESGIYECKAKGIFRSQGMKPLVGDNVELTILDEAEKTGNIVGVKAVNKDDEVMMITTEGIIIRIRVNDTALLGRITSGVKLMNLKDDVVIASIAKVREDKSLMKDDENSSDQDQTDEVVTEETTV